MDKKDQMNRDELANKPTVYVGEQQPSAQHGQAAPTVVSPRGDHGAADAKAHAHQIGGAPKAMNHTQIDPQATPAAPPPHAAQPPFRLAGAPQPKANAGDVVQNGQVVAPGDPGHAAKDGPPRTVWIGAAPPKDPAPAMMKPAPAMHDMAAKAAVPPAPTIAPPATEHTRIIMPATQDVFDPVVGWLVVISGPGKGNSRPIRNGNNPVGRSARQRIPLDFGDDAISGEEQAFIRYDPIDRAFMLIPNMAKANLVAVNEKRPTSAVVLNAGDVIGMGRTKLLFAPLCGPHFDWSDQDGDKKM